MAIGKNLKYILKHKKMSLKELADNSGVSVHTLYGIIKRDNQTVKPDILEKISNSLNISAMALYDNIQAVNELFPDTESIRTDDNFEDSLKLLFQDDVDQLGELENKILEAFSKLNEEGKIECLKRVEELSYIPQYSRS